MFNKILIANRGEIACRIIKTARGMGIKTVAVYSTSDQNSLHANLADEAYCIGEAKAITSYLNIDAIINAALAANAQAIHPGYGFLSENPHFSQACIDAGITFIGPSAAAMNAMASKQLAKQLLENTDVPLTPGYHGQEQSDEHLFKEAQKIGFPVLLKAAAGGGGKGMRAVYKADDFVDALKAARREAKSSFNDEVMLIERLMEKPRHIEVQIMADNRGNFVHLFERDCSIQRRHQKIIEEAPAPNISQKLRNNLTKAALTVARKIYYQGAGTVEFLVDGNERFYFMEMNTRLQVEHPVTEMITGLDLVEWQLRIAANETLPCTQDEININGHAIECRIYAEDPSQGFIPSTGRIEFLKEPRGPGLRIDSGVCQDSLISMHYDPMIAKLIAWGSSREQALNRLQHALSDYHLGGIKTNASFLQAITNHPGFIDAKLSTHFLEDETINTTEVDAQQAILFAASMDYLLLQTHHDPLKHETFSWQMHLQSHWHQRYQVGTKTRRVMITPRTRNQFSLQIDGLSKNLKVSLSNQRLHLEDGEQKQTAWVENYPTHMIFYTLLGQIKVNRFSWQNSSQSDTNAAQLTAPMPAMVVAILKHKGDAIKTGDQLMILEAMKMEHTIHAPTDGLISDVFYQVGAQVNEGAQLFALQCEEEKSV